MGAAGDPLEGIYAEIEPTIGRETAYWVKKFPRREGVTREILYQEGWAVAAHILGRFDPSRGVKLTTLLTVSLRNHFSTLLGKTFRDLHHRGPSLDTSERSDADNPREPGEQVGLVTLAEFFEALTNDERRVMGWLLDCDGNPRIVSRQHEIPLTTVNRFRRSLQRQAIRAQLASQTITKSRNQ